MAKKIELLRYRLLPASASFTEGELRERGGAALNELKMLYPMLTGTAEYSIGTHFQNDGESICLVVEISQTSQERLKQIDKRSSSDDAMHDLESVAKMILASGCSSQDRIYQQAQEINQAIMTLGDALSKDDISFRALLKRRKNQQIKICTYAGQDQFDFPEIIETTVIEQPVSVSGYVEWVGKRGFRLWSIKIDGERDMRYKLPAYHHQKDVYFQADIQDILAIGRSVLDAAFDRRRILIRANVVMRATTGSIAHFILHDPKVRSIEGRRR